MKKIVFEAKVLTVATPYFCICTVAEGYLSFVQPACFMATFTNSTPNLSLCGQYLPPVIALLLSLISPKSNIPPILTHFLAHIFRHPSRTRVYTDDSKSTSDTEVFPSHTYNFLLPPEASILTAEIYVILFTLQCVFHLFLTLHHFH